MNPAEKILQTLSKHMEGPGRIRLLGGAALILGYELHRSTEDADLLLDEREVDELIESANFGEALEKTNRELEPVGLYLTHIWGPEQQILSPSWRTNCRALAPRGRLDVQVLGPLDLILSKLCRGDDADMDDIRHLVRIEKLRRTAVESALAEAVVPEVFEDVFHRNQIRLRALLDEEGL